MSHLVPNSQPPGGHKLVPPASMNQHRAPSMNPPHTTPTRLHQAKEEHLLAINKQLLHELSQLKSCLALSIGSEEQLQRVLENEDVADRFQTEDHPGSVFDLYQQLRSGFCALERSREDFTLRRVTEVVRLRILYGNLCLVESHKQSADGRLFFTKQLLPHLPKSLYETCETAVLRFLKETFSPLVDESFLNAGILQPKVNAYVYTEETVSVGVGGENENDKGVGGAGSGGGGAAGCQTSSQTFGKSYPGTGGGGGGAAADELRRCR